MHKFFTPSEYVFGDYAKIIGDDVKHIYKVLRLSEGEEVVLNDCNGTEYLAKINEVTKSEVTLDIVKKLDLNNESNIEIVLFQGMPKAQKMDLIVQKGTELGITKFVPLITDRVDVKLKGDFKKLDRLNRIALEACKQSKRSIIPRVLEPIKINDLIKEIKEFDLLIVPYENKEDFGIKSLMKDLDKNSIKRIGIVVGPEGGFEEAEIEKLKTEGAYIITLGKRILRTETAGFVATSLIQYELGDLGGKI
ncbi:16S rRNA (uracil(1498)-N(3))-methyltransferase [Clostridium sp.]|uniref:16S rRNA (uracil(1498)-N(3))-methyltransferase n=1 Tax=Clostridium sp. TaxID=1506 RepID=UPI0026DD334D|nr:16S rRNA (uracil(1498)-N(3))-methyltransferase [Clostridium sp.]MDO5038765.1 16S rRNA (uracil(1498)-N(3))-methyltransferase [Clostridium sp.]